MAQRRHRIHGVILLGIALVAAISAFIAYSLPGAVGVARADRAECGGPGRVFLVGGTWDLTGDTLIGVRQRYTGLGPDNKPDPSNPHLEDPYTVDNVPYPATIWPLGAIGYDASQDQGAQALKQSIAAYQQQCPGKKVVIVGYSQGARVAGDVLTDIGRYSDVPVTMPDGTTAFIAGKDADGNRIVSGELYSDPRMSGTPWGSGIELSLVGVIPGLTMSGPRADADFGGVPVTTYCIAGDPICDLPDLFHDPIGTFDGVLGYIIKHGQYPFHMYQDPVTGTTWVMNGAGQPMTCTQDDALQTCIIASPSAMSIIVQNAVNAVGLRRTVPDLMSYRFRFPDVIGITLADFQVPIQWAMDWLPQLPELGYGAYLPDLYVFGDLLTGAITLDPATFWRGASAVGASLQSIAMLPVNLVKYWAQRVVEGVTTLPKPQSLSTTDASHVTSFTPAGSGPAGSGPAGRSVAGNDSERTVGHPGAPAASVERSTIHHGASESTDSAAPGSGSTASGGTTPPTAEPSRASLPPTATSTAPTSTAPSATPSPSPSASPVVTATP